MVNRDRCDLLRSVLCLLVDGPKSKVDIAFGCRFSNEQNKSTVRDMLELKLMEVADVKYARSQHYQITPKGTELLKILAELNDMISMGKGPDWT